MDDLRLKQINLMIEYTDKYNKLEKDNTILPSVKKLGLMYLEKEFREKILKIQEKLNG